MSTPKSHVEELGFSSKHLFSPLELVDRFPRSVTSSETVQNGRETFHRILNGDDKRLMIITGPCSVHDEEVALDYARRLVELRDQLSEKIFLVIIFY